MAAVASATRVSIPGFALEVASSKFAENNIQDGKRYFSITSNLSREMETAVYRQLWVAKGSPQGNPRYGEDCFHYRKGLSATGQELAQVIETYLDSLDLADNARERQRGDPSNRTFLHCPITLQPMTNPVIDRSGHTFEAEAITQWIARGPDYVCPIGNEPIAINELIPNRAIRDAIEACNAAADEPAQGESASQAYFRQRNVNLGLRSEFLAEIHIHHVAMDRLRREVRVFMDGYLDLQRQSDQLTEAVSQRDRVARDLRARIDNLTAENSALRESERNLQNTVHQRQTTVDERNRTIAQQGGTIAGYESTIQERDRTLQERDRTLQERDRTIARQREDIARQERVAQDQDIRIRDLETRVTALQQNFQTQINQLKNVENMSFIDAMKLAGAPLFGRRQVIIRHIMNERR